MNRIIKAFSHAISGLHTGVKRDRNFRIHLAVSVLAVALGAGFSISKSEWLAIILSIGITFSAELFNSSIEELCDAVHPSFSQAIGRVKDMSAAAVLVLATGSSITGLIIFTPYIFQYFI